MASEVGRSRPGGRAERVRRSVLAAALVELAEHGQDLSIEDVAACAGVHKTTVYRRWPTRDDLVAAALQEHVTRALSVPDTGDVDEDLPVFAAAVAATLRTPGDAVVARTLLAPGTLAPELSRAAEAYHANRLGALEGLLRRAVRARQLPSVVDVREMSEAVVAPLFLALLMRAPMQDDRARRLAGGALVAARAGAYDQAEAPRHEGTGLAAT